MSHTKKHKKSKSTRRRTLRTTAASSSKKHQELYAKNKKRNSIIRNIRMGRSTFNRLGGGGGYIRKDGYNTQKGGSGYISQFIGSPWTVSNNPTMLFHLQPTLVQGLKELNRLQVLIHGTNPLRAVVNEFNNKEYPWFEV